MVFLGFFSFLILHTLSKTAFHAYLRKANISRLDAAHGIMENSIAIRRGGELFYAWSQTWDLPAHLCTVWYLEHSCRRKKG